MKSLRYLYLYHLYHIELDASAVAELREALPACQIHTGNGASELSAQDVEPPA
ncbi:MAG: hypothetical protein WCL32_09695 [Planctomycetota bacterium]